MRMHGLSEGKLDLRVGVPARIVGQIVGSTSMEDNAMELGTMIGETV